MASALFDAIAPSPEAEEGGAGMLQVLRVALRRLARMRTGILHRRHARAALRARLLGGARRGGFGRLL